jgi:hypothetical protein
VRRRTEGFTGTAYSFLAARANRITVCAATTQRSRGAATQYFSNYRDCIIATSVHAFDRRPFEASFVIISRKIAGGDEEVVHTERLENTFAYSGDARAAASRAAQAYVDNRALV